MVAALSGSQSVNGIPNRIARFAINSHAPTKVGELAVLKRQVRAAFDATVRR